MTTKKINSILALHAAWLSGGRGKRADLRRADLSGAVYDSCVVLYARHTDDECAQQD